MESNSQDKTTQEQIDNENYYAIVKPLRTFERDVAESVRSKKPTQISINLAEKRKREAQNSIHQTNNSYENRDKNISLKKIFIILLLALTVIIGIILLPKLWNTVIKESLTQTPEQEIKIINADKIIKIDVTIKVNATILASIEENLQKIQSGESGNIVIISPIELIKNKEEKVDGEKFLKIIAPNVPAPLIRSFGEKINFGYYVKSGKYTPFFILNISSFQNAYSSMLNWENNMKEDLQNLITENTKNLGTAPFYDLIIKNKDTRVSRDNQGIISLIYSFLDNKTLLITTNRGAFEAVVDRYLLNLSRKP